MCIVRTNYPIGTRIGALSFKDRNSANLQGGGIMGLRINTNTASLNAQRVLWGTKAGLDKSMEKLASGFRINRAGDDAAGLAISENLKLRFTV